MKFVKDQSYLWLFPLVIVAWFGIGFLLSPIVDGSFILTFGLGVIVLSIMQLYSGVAIDRSWRATISRQEEPTWFFIIVVGQLVMGGVALGWAFN